jgi:biotin transport system substrate-specific component
MLTGNVIIYLVGLPWLAVVLDTNLEKTFEYGLYPFVPGDMFKLYLAAAVLPTAWRLVGRVRGDTRTRR